MKRTLFVTAMAVPLLASPAVANAPSLEAIYNEVWARGIQVSIARGQDEAHMRDTATMFACGLAYSPKAETADVLKRSEELRLDIIKDTYTSMYPDGFEGLSSEEMLFRVLPVAYALELNYSAGYTIGFQDAIAAFFNLDNNYRKVTCRSARERLDALVRDADALLLEEGHRLEETQD